MGKGTTSTNDAMKSTKSAGLGLANEASSKQDQAIRGNTGGVCAAYSLFGTQSNTKFPFPRTSSMSTLDD